MANSFSGRSTAATGETSGAAPTTLRRAEAPAPAASPKPLVVRYRTTPADAKAVVARGEATVERQADVFAATVTEAAAMAGVELTFSKSGFASKRVRIETKDAASSAPLDVSLDPVARVTAEVAVIPRSAEVTANDGEANKVDHGRWKVSFFADAKAVIVASAAGFASRRMEVSPAAGPLRVLLKASATDWWKPYRAMSADGLLRLVGRAGAFGYGARALALSRNGRFLAVAERQWPTFVHVWDVDNERFVGRVLRNDEIKSARTNGPYAPPVSVAVSNDGRTVALSCFVVSIFNVAAGKEVRKFGKDETKLTGRAPKEPEVARSAAVEPTSSDSQDALWVCFSADDSKLYVALRNGRIVVRDASDWKTIETLTGLDAGSEDVRLNADG